jgi:hypothetical protein
MKIGIIYICTGKYSIFWKDFYLSSEKNFLPEAEKHYFVFTDASEIDYEKGNPRIHKIYQKDLGWPDNTLMRYDIFLKLEEEISDTDYLFYLNANLLFLEKISAGEFLPQNQEKLVGCLHPGYYNKSPEKYTYENNPQSMSYIKPKDGMKYYAGGINGGITKYFIEAIKIINSNIKIDLKRNITAKWHDESHWNWYLNNNIDIIKTLSPSYLYPEGADLPFETKILIRNKNLLGGHANFRKKTELRLIINNTKDLIKKILNKLKTIKTIYIKGGLGNQMFQYAYGRNLELAGKKIIFNISFLDKNKLEINYKRNFKLENFRIETRAQFSNREQLIIRLFNKVLMKLGLKEYGYWQGEKYFKEIELYIRKEFTLKKPLDSKFDNIIKQIDGAPSVSIHVRRGDYVNDPKTRVVHNVCGLEYYRRAINIIKAQVNNPTFFVFSDDIDWVRENLPIDYPSYHVSNLEGEDYEELILMSKCKHNIIANSTFSWWGAWLNQNPNKIVIAPKQWFTNKTSNEINILPKDWLQI